METMNYLLEENSLALLSLFKRILKAPMGRQWCLPVFRLLELIFKVSIS